MWSGSNPTAPNWKGDNQLPGGEELYFVPAVSNTTDINKIGIVDGNLIEMPTSYPYLQVALLETTNIENAENIITDNIDCNTINNNPVPVDASQWSLYPAIHQVEMETYALKNASSVEANVVLKVGTATTGGSLNIGTDNYNPASAPSVSIGNSTIGKSSTSIYGANNLTGYGALSVTGGVTLDAGSITDNEGLSIHGVNIYAAGVEGISTVRATFGELGVSIYTAQPEVQGISINALASAVTINTGTELTTRSVLGTEVEAGTGLYVSGLTDGSYNDGRMFIQHICPAYAETTNLLIDGKNDLTSGVTGVELRDGVLVDTDILQVREIDNRDATGVNINSNSGGITLTTTDAGDTPYDITLSSIANVVSNSGADTTISSGGNTSITATYGDLTATSTNGNVIISSAYDLTATSTNGSTSLTCGQGALSLTTQVGRYGATDVNVVSNRAFQCFAGNTNGGGSSYDGELKYLCGSNVLFASYNGGNITFDNTTDGNGNIPITRRQIFTAGADISFTAGTGSNVNMNSTLNMNGNDIIANTIRGATDLVLATSSNGSIGLSPNGTGVIIANKGLLMGGNSITQAPYISSNGSLTFVTAAGANTSSIDFSTNDIINVKSINGHNLYSYGKFYNTTSQSLTATGTATRVKLNTAGTASGITLDTSTNIGRLTFSNAGTYQVTWNGYFVRASGTANNFIWIRLNGTDVAGTGKKQRTDAGLSEISIGGSTQVTVTSGQYIEFFWAADDINTSLTSYAASSPYPAIPGFSCAISIIA